jgi:hypothetical protein
MTIRVYWFERDGHRAPNGPDDSGDGLLGIDFDRLVPSRDSSATAETLIWGILGKQIARTLREAL